MTPRFRIRSASATHTGGVRKVNEDSLLEREAAGVWSVADGMGGHQNGQWASQTVVAALAALELDGADIASDVAAIGAAVQAANATIFNTAQEAGVQMGSTVAILRLAGDRFACAWAGDSRAYLMRDGALHRLTVDHTQVQEMVDRGLLSPEEAVRHPMGHILARAVGVQAEVTLDAVSDQVRPRDVFLLCSDGLTGVVSDPEIAERLSQSPVDAACRRLVELVLSRGAPDNVTVVAVACEEMTQLVLGQAFTSAPV
ncbi:PP2C family protein-serine/threonine phosphatase [Caulobacter sp. LARHSG274]